MFIFAVVHLLLIATLAYQAHSRFAFLHAFGGLPGYLLSCALTLFLVNWFDFVLYVLLGWGLTYLILSWMVPALVLAYAYASRPPAPARDPRGRWAAFRQLCGFHRVNGWFLFLAAFVLARFYAGLDEDDQGQIWVVFNFVDTAFHLSVANAFLEASRFPPMDLDLAPYPLKYHFLADFYLAHLIQLGWAPLKAIWTMNLVSALLLVGSLWAVFERWLKLPARWVMLGGFIFLFLNTSLVNLLHYFAFKPAFFNPREMFSGVMWYPYFNFESSLANLFEPQRGLLFTMPVLLLILHAIFGEPAPATGPAAAVAEARNRTLGAFLLTCLLPLSHIVGFVVMSFSLVPRLWRHGRWFLRCYRWWLPVFAIGVLQLLYLLCYGPAGNPHFSGWDATASLPLNDYKSLPLSLRRLAFWFFVNGDFFFWSTALGGVALLRRLRAPAAAGPRRLTAFLHRWRWYLAVCSGFFILINFYRYSFAWGDSNKFVLFLNLGLSLTIVAGAAQWLGGRARLLSHALWLLLLVLTIAPPTYVFCRRVFVYPLRNNLFFHRYEVAAGEWLKAAAGPSDFVLTAAYTDSHFVTSLAAQPTLAGIYADSNPNRPYGRGEAIRQVYEEDSLPALARLNVRYLCISRTERRVYKLHPQWLARMKAGTAVVFHAGESSEFESVFIFDVPQLIARLRAPQPRPAHPR